MKYTFTVEGKVPSKKNNWKPTGRGGIYTKRDTKDNIGGIIRQLSSQKWTKGKGLFPMEGNLSVSMVFSIRLRMMSRDLDNMATTILDALQDSGIIENDRFVMKLATEKRKGEDDVSKITVKTL